MKFYDESLTLFLRDSIHFQWKFDPQGAVPSQLDFVVERSGSPSGPWDELATVDPRTTFSYHDDTAPLRAMNDTHFYRIRVVRKSDGVTVHESRAVSYDNDLPLDAKWIIKQQTILLEGVNGHKAIKGRPVTVYKKITNGPPCDICTDKTTGQVIISNCMACVGTGIDRGYYNGITVGMNLTPATNMKRLTNMQAVSDTDLVAVLNNFPALESGDILVELSEKHWRVTRQDPRERNRNLVRQQVFLTQIKPDDIVNELRHRDHGGRKEST